MSLNSVFSQTIFNCLLVEVMVLISHGWGKPTKHRVQWANKCSGLGENTRHIHELETEIKSMFVFFFFFQMEGQIISNCDEFQRVLKKIFRASGDTIFFHYWCLRSIVVSMNSCMFFPNTLYLLFTLVI